ncbi:MAG: hypothetical protein N4A44_02250 [Alphaproteobacteria bacterium]|nr:hypothetical protein [Alphaproteobacteria bacterium]
MKKIKFNIFLLFSFLLSKTSFSMTNDELTKHVFDGESNIVARFFAQFFDFISGSLFSFYEIMIEYVYVFLFFGFAFWIVKYMWQNLIEAGGGLEMGEFDVKDYWKNLFQMIFKAIIITSTVLLISPRGNFEKGGTKVAVPPRIIFKYIYDPIILIGTSTSRYVMNQYSESYINKETDPKIKKRYEDRLLQGDFCRNEINKWSTFEEPGRLQDPRYSNGVSSQFLNDSIKIEFMCLIGAYQKLISSFDAYAINMGDIYISNFLTSDLGGSFLLILFLVSIIIFIIYCIKSRKFMMLIAWLVPILQIALIFLLLFTNFGFLLVALSYGYLSFYLKILGGLKLVGDFLIMSIFYMIFPIIAGLWIFNRGGDFQIISMKSMFDRFKKISMGIFSLSISFIVVMTLNESFLSIYYRNSDDVLFSVKENLTTGNIEAFTQNGDLFPLFINMFLLIIVTIFLNSNDKIAGKFLLGTVSEKLGNTLEKQTKNAWKKITKPVNKYGAKKLKKYGAKESGGDDD